jgi:hypothetical protein
MNDDAGCIASKQVSIGIERLSCERATCYIF